MDGEDKLKKELKEVKNDNLTLMGRNYTNHTLKKLIPISKKGSPTEDKTYLFESEYNFRIGYNRDSMFYLDPSGGPLLEKGAEVPIISTVDGKKIIDTIKIKDITYSENMGYIITIE